MPMAKIKIGNREAGKGLSKGHSTADSSSDQELFEAIRDELDAKGGILSPDATDLATAITLVNEMKAALNVIAKFDKK